MTDLSPSKGALDAARALLLANGYRVDLVSTKVQRDASWLQLHGREEGVVFNIFYPRKTRLHLDTLAHGLSHEGRFAAQTRVFYQIAIHCYRGSFLLQDPADALDFMFHDASEGLGLRDIPGPVKRLPEMAFYREREHEVMTYVAERFRLREGFWERPAVKAADERMLHVEQGEMLAPPPVGYEWGFWANRVAGRERGYPLSYTGPQAKRLWLLRVAELSRVVGREDLREEALAVVETDLREEVACSVRLP